MKKYDTLIFIGRFQPLHNGHLHVIQKALSITRELIIIVGSAKQPRTFKNPWTEKERILMIQNALNAMDTGDTRVHIESNTDTIYNDAAWAARIQGIVSKYRCLGGKTAIIGHRKDESSFYLDMFPQWELEEVDQASSINATDIRAAYFKPNQWKCPAIVGLVPECVLEFLLGSQDNTYFKQICREREFIEKYKEQYSQFPYPPIFVTTDAVVHCSGHILMIKRKAEPGKGLWALPGGFVNAYTDKSLQDAMIRELKEETSIKVPVPVLVGSIQCSQVFDAIGRSARGRTITHAYLINLGIQELPKVKGSDDAEQAKWVPIGAIDSTECFEDHYEIITSMMGL